MPKVERTFTSHEVAHLLGVNIKTIQRRDREGRLKAADRTATGRRYYTEDQILAFRHQRAATTGSRQTVAYYRVSRQSQRHALKNQRRALEQFCTARGLANVAFMGKD